jgi:hypothetical protein
MSITTYERMPAGSGTAPVAARPSRRPGLFARLMNRLIEARQRQAAIELRRHLLPHELEQAGWQVTERSEDSLPFRQ